MSGSLHLKLNDNGGFITCLCVSLSDVGLKIREV